MTIRDAPRDLGFTPQPMVRWLGPRGLSVTALQVLLSTIFGAYSDKREIQAALKESGESDFSDRDALWIDFLADTGDGFDPTYATAMLATEELEFQHEGVTHTTPRGDLLVLGGDLAYPAATADEYRNRFVGPFEGAFPAPPDGAVPPTMFVCAGNHDWYDGLTTFLRLFCEGKQIGGWRTEQSRSYFTVKLPHRWWILGIDLAFDFFIDEPQMSFFRRVASEDLQPGDKVILITHRPSWLFADIGENQLYTEMSMTNLQQFEHEIIHANKLELPLVLAGDIHHYNRYATADGQHQRITSGAAAAFLYPTNHLAKEFRWPEAEGNVKYEQAAVYPSKKTSRHLRWGTLLAPFKNPSFVAFVALLYLVFALVVRFALTEGTSLGLTKALRDTDPNDVVSAVFNNPFGFIVAFGLLAVFIGFADAPTLTRRIAVGFVHWLFQLILLVTVIWETAQLVYNLPANKLEFEFSFVDFTLKTDAAAFIVIIAVAGGLLGAELFALYLFLMFRLFRKHATHSFSSQRIPDYRNFLRVRIDSDGGLTIYTIGVRRVPRKWRYVAERARPDQPRFEPTDRPLEAHLIEPPIYISADGRTVDTPERTESVPV
ncbi:MAG: metallophosphoesterase family protein [Acidimicrobiia bacterium]